MKYNIVIDNPTVAHAQELKRNIDHNVAVHSKQPGLSAHDLAMLPHKITTLVEAQTKARPKGTIHASAVTFDCPDGGDNCRNCGDPNHAAECQAAGHCPYCGTRHGVAPDRILVANGYKLVEAI